MENVDLKNANSLEEKANRAWSDKNYYVGHNDKEVRFFHRLRC